jgi:hypothetical protein
MYEFEDAIEVLKQEQERRQIMAIIRKIREMGGEDTIKTLAGYMMISSPKPTKEVMPQ